VRYSDPQVVVPPRRVELKAFQGQPRKYSGSYRFPQLVIANSKISNAGDGLFLGEMVRAGQPLTLYRRNFISEARGNFLQKKESNFSFTLLLVVWLCAKTELLALLQGNRHIRINRAACCCLDSKPTSKFGLGYMSQHHEAAGMANSSKTPNAKFVDVGFDTILVAKFDMAKGVELLPKYSWCH
jgi:hypothetical protein